MEEIHGIHKLSLQSKKFFIFYCHVRVRELLSFLEKCRKTFLQFDLQKNTNFVIYNKNLLQHVSENLSAIVCRLPLLH